jgi:hypothetical protein
MNNDHHGAKSLRRAKFLSFSIGKVTDSKRGITPDFGFISGWSRTPAAPPGYALKSKWWSRNAL